jgi:hypothetical protein
MDFSQALDLIKAGRKVEREGWNGKGMHIALHEPHEHDKMDLPFVYMQTVQGDHVPWLCSQTDMLAEDWAVVE